jgi:hypothetical protein
MLKIRLYRVKHYNRFMFKKFAHRITNSLSLWLAGFSFAIIYVGLLTYFLVTKHAPFEYATFNMYMVGIATIVPLLTVAISFLRLSVIGDEVERKYWLPLMLLISVAYAFVLGISGYLFSIIFSTAFRNMTFDFIGAPFILASFGGLLAYFVAENVQRFDRRHFAYLIVATFLSGFFLAAIKTWDNFWWQGSVCSLGMPVNGHPIYFNFTLVMTGLLLALFSVYLGPTIKSLRANGYLDNTRVRILNWVYFALVIMLVLVGLFPYGVNEVMNKFHVYMGQAIFGAFAGFLLLSALIFKKFPLSFRIASYFMLAVGFAFYLFHFEIDYLAYAVSELMMIVVLGSWFMIFVRTITVLAKEGD